MQKRARDVAGTLEILSTRESGTKVCVKATLQQKNLRKRILAKIKTGFQRIPTDFDAR
jgi:hypothetical protein